MGSTASDKPDELTVLITGFGPFKEDFPRNPSWEITRELPDYLPPAPAKSALHFRPRDADTPVLPPVRIRKYPEPVRVNYQVVRALVPTLWGDKAGGGSSDDAAAATAAAAAAPAEEQKEGQGGEDAGARQQQKQQREAGKPGGGGGGSGKPRIDLMLHLGMAGPRPYYSIERRGHRDGYRGRDVDGQLLGDEERHLRERERWIWHGLPHDLETDLDLDDVIERWRGYSPWDSDVRVSGDAGRYLCDFIYYSSLAHLYRAGEYRRVLFLHVPADCSQDALRRGVNLTLQLIRAVLESELARKAKTGQDKEKKEKEE